MLIEDMSFIVFVLSLGILIGIVIGTTYEDKYGAAREESKRYFASLMRMIPLMKQHYTKQYIYELIRGEEDDAPKT